MKFKVGDKFIDTDYPHFGVATIYRIGMEKQSESAEPREYYWVDFSGTKPREGFKGGRFADDKNLRLLTPLEELL